MKSLSLRRCPSYSVAKSTSDDLWKWILGSQNDYSCIRQNTNALQKLKENTASISGLPQHTSHILQLGSIQKIILRKNWDWKNTFIFISTKMINFFLTFVNSIVKLCMTKLRTLASTLPNCRRACLVGSWCVSWPTHTRDFTGIYFATWWLLRFCAVR